METCSALAGCTLQLVTPIPGMAKLVEVPDTSTLAELLLLPGVRYMSNRALRGWYVPLGVVHQGRMPALLSEWSPDPEELTPRGLRLDTYERRSVSFLMQGGPGGEGSILAAEPGLGKTCCALQALHRLGLLTRPGVICGNKKSQGAWIGEEKDPAKYFGVHVEPMHGSKPDLELLKRHQVIFVHYEIIRHWWEAIFRNFPAEWIIFDEIHLLSNPDAEQSKAAASISMAGKVVKRLGLTGTPIENSRMDLWNQLKIVQPRQWDTYHLQFGICYCDGKRGTEYEGGHWSFDGESNTGSLVSRLAGTILHYGPEDIPGGEITFPKAIRSCVEVTDLSQDWWQAYYAALRDTIVASVGPAQLESLTRELGLLSEAKVPAAVEQAKLLLGRGHTHIVTLASRRLSAHMVHRVLKQELGSMVFGPVTGADVTDQEERERLADEFSKQPRGIYVASLGAVGTSINNLDCASGLLHSDLWWNSAKLIQGERRLLRRSNKNPIVEIVYLRVPGTADDKITELIFQKALATQAISSSGVEGVELAKALGICAPEQKSLKAILDRAKEIASELGYQ